MTNIGKKQDALLRIIEIMDDLRAKCPWDKKQTIHTLRHLTIEETFELSDAIAENDTLEIKKELGDLFLHIIFYCKIGEENNWFDFADVVNQLCEKLIRRHPHIYGNIIAEDAETVKQNWEKIKLAEKNNEESVLAGVPKSLPSMIKAYRIQGKASDVGFDWEKEEDVLKKVKEEWREFLNEKDQIRREEELGDVLFSIINYARYIGINPDDALEKTNKKFIKRFEYIEQQARRNNKKITDLTLSEMDVYWNEAKKY